MGVDEFLAAATRSEKKAAHRKANPLESKHEKDFEKWCSARGIWCIKLVFFVGSGWPDRSLLCPGGRICFVEMKRDKEGGTLSPAQIAVRRRIKSLGFKYFVGYGSKDAIKKVEKWLTK